jgi:uncharacterized protein (TIGR03083 family)
MVPERDVDCGELYEQARLRFVALLRSCGANERSTTVPATPAWTVLDVLSHVVGIAVDLNAGNFGSTADPDAWTASQIDARRDRAVDEIAAEWDRATPKFADGLRLLGYEIGSHFLGDLLQHETDVRHALGRPKLADDLALAVGLDFYLISFEETLDADGVGAVEIAAGEESWTLGTGAPVAALHADRFELFRALGGRRTEAEIGALSWHGDAAAIIPRLSRYPLPRASLGE